MCLLSNRVLKHRRFWATDVNRKFMFLLLASFFYRNSEFQSSHFSIYNCIWQYQQKATKRRNFEFRLTSVAQKLLCSLISVDSSKLVFQVTSLWELNVNEVIYSNVTPLLNLFGLHHLIKTVLYYISLSHSNTKSSYHKPCLLSWFPAIKSLAWSCWYDQISQGRSQDFSKGGSHRAKTSLFIRLSCRFYHLL